MIPIRHPELEKLKKQHWNWFEDQKFDFKLIENQEVRCFLETQKKEIILGEPNTLTEIKNAFQKEFSKIKFNGKRKNSLQKDLFLQICQVFNYDKFSRSGDWNSQILVKKLGISVCPYCNRNFIKGTENQRIDELDHFYPKSKYPFLAISFYNLIPSCKTCNQTFKGTKEISVNPYEMPEKFNFRLKIKDSSFYYAQNGFEIDFSEVEKVLKKNCSELKIKELYKNHQDQILELIQKQVTYSDDYIDDLFRRYEGTLFKNRENVLRHLAGNYVSENDFHLRPLAKLTHDIAAELGLI